MANPLCEDNCDETLAEVAFSECAPEINLSEIKRIWMGNANTSPFDNWADAAEWLARVSQTSLAADSLRELTVIGDMPAGAAVNRDISNGRQITVGKDRTVNFTIDDVSDPNYEFARQTECGNKRRFWFETHGGKMYGGNKGIKSKVLMDLVLNRGVDEIETIVGVLTWRSKFSPERITSPIFESDND